RSRGKACPRASDTEPLERTLLCDGPRRQGRTQSDVFLTRFLVSHHRRVELRYLREREAGHVQHHAQYQKQSNVVNQRPGMRLFRRVVGKTAPTHGRGDQKKNVVIVGVVVFERIARAGEKEENDASHSGHHTLYPRQCEGRFRSIQPDHSDHIQQVQPRSYVGQHEKNIKMRPPENSPARERGEQAKQWPSQRDAGQVFAGDAHPVPAHVRAQAGKKHWKIDLQPATFCGDEVAELVNENGERETERELPAENGPVKAEEDCEAQQELQLENDEEERLNFEQEKRYRSERSKALGPARLPTFLGLQI